MSHYERKINYLHNNRIIYRKFPIFDKATEVYDWGWYYENGTHECYELFRSKAKITTYKSLKWHLLVLLYLNPDIEQDKFVQLAEVLAEEKNGFVAFKISKLTLHQIIADVNETDLTRPPTNRSRKIIFKEMTGLTTVQKLSIVGKLVGRAKKATEEDIYETMLFINELNQKITVKRIAKNLKVSTRTIYRSMTTELKQEKELLNSEL